ncbi:MAG: tyrosine-protein phosphatase [Candidatus Gastranaerophilales bacterium]|nr:tyrosine-protein phosphatase [Candidatus Gastranaerophilales bacterium]
MIIQPITFTARPLNYSKIDNTVSRSAQPQKEDLKWLKEQGVTDVFNFRTMYKSGLNFDEKTEVEKLGMRYHSIPSITRHPKEENIDTFLKEVEEVKSNGGKAHIHCKAGADRTGMYSFIYKAKNHIDNAVINMQEWLAHGHNQKLYPDLAGWTQNFVKNRF